MKTACVAAAALLTLSLTACGGGDSGRADKPGKTRADKSSVDCSDQSLSQADWVKHCAGNAEGGGTGGDGKAKEPKPVKLGTSVKTAGAQNPVGGEGGGLLEVTPTTVVYAEEGTGARSQNGVFAVVTVKDRALKEAAAESAPIEGGGWQWIAPGGEAIEEGNGDEAVLVTPPSFTGGGMVRAGSFAWDSAVFDLEEDQRGGTLVYVDGEGVEYRWRMPKADSGPQVAELKRELAG